MDAGCSTDCLRRGLRGQRGLTANINADLNIDCSALKLVEHVLPREHKTSRSLQPALRLLVRYPSPP